MFAASSTSPANGTSSIGKPTGKPTGKPSGTKAGAKGFSLIEVLIALAILLVGGVSIMAVFALAADLLVQRKLEERLILVRSEARTMAQDAVNAAEAGKPPRPIGDGKDPASWRSTSQPGFSVAMIFVPSPHGARDDPWTYVAQVRIAYRGTELPPAYNASFPAFVTRSTLDPLSTRK